MFLAAMDFLVDSFQATKVVRFQPLKYLNRRAKQAEGKMNMNAEGGEVETRTP